MTSFIGSIGVSGSVGIVGGSVGILPPLPQPIGLAYANRSIVSLTGSAQQLMPANASRHALILQNTGNADAAVNLTGGTPVIDTAGSITLGAGEILVIEQTPPTSAIMVVGTAAQPFTAYEA